MNELDRDLDLRARFGARTLLGPSASLRERVLTIPERGLDAPRSWLGARSRGTSRMPRILLVAAVVSGSLVGLWAAVGQQPSPPDQFPPGSIAFGRGGDLWVAGADGSAPTLVAPGDADDLFQFAVAPDGRTIAFTRLADEVPGTRLSIRSADGRTLGSFVGPNEMQFSWAPDSRRIAAVSTAGESAIIGLDGHQIAPIVLPEGWVTTYVEGLEWTSWSPDGRWIAVPGCVLPCNPKHDLRFLLTAADGSGSHTADPSQPGGDGGGSSVAWAPDSRLAVFRGGYAGPAATITIVTGDGTVVHRPTERSSIMQMPPPPWTLPNGQFVKGSAWSPDGTRLVVTTNAGDEREGQIWVIASDGTSSLLPIDPAYALGQVAWSEDERSLLFTGRSTPPSADVGCCTTGLWTIDPDGGHQQLLIDGASHFSVGGR